MMNEFLKVAILNEIKAHNSEDEYLCKFNHGIKLERVERRENSTNDVAFCSYIEDEKRNAQTILMRLEAVCTYKPDYKVEGVDKRDTKYLDNVVFYEVLIYSNGEMCAMYDGLKSNYYMNKHYEDMKK